jgi:hypothetical protein
MGTRQPKRITRSAESCSSETFLGSAAEIGDVMVASLIRRRVLTWANPEKKSNKVPLENHLCIARRGTAAFQMSWERRGKVMDGAREPSTLAAKAIKSAAEVGKCARPSQDFVRCT